MDFRRIDSLPPYVFATINELKAARRRSGEDVIDLEFGNPDVPSPPFVVDKLIEAARRPTNHNYSSSRGLPNLRKAVADRYMRRFGVDRCSLGVFHKIDSEDAKAFKEAARNAVPAANPLPMPPPEDIGDGNEN